jgi:purine catabolism regulatory family protein/PucR-like helix-turn-helix protein
MAITVNEIVGMPQLQTRFHSGEVGGEQRINWAHSCEMPDPWHWLEPFDLLMTNGLGMPTDPAEQARYVNILADAGISGIAVGQGVGAPPISNAMAEASNERALPILLTAYEVPFAAVARVVAESKTDAEERRRLLKTARIYESLRAAAINHRDAASLFDELGSGLGCRLDVLDMAVWHYAFDPARVAAPALRQVLTAALLRGGGHLPAVLRTEMDGRAAFAVPVPSRRRAALLVSRFEEATPELSVLQHVSTVAALELEKLGSERDARYRLATELLVELLAPEPDAQRAAARLEAVGLTGPIAVAAWRHPGSVRSPGRADRLSCAPISVHQDLYARGVPHLLRPGDGDEISLALIPADRGSVALLLETLPDDCCVGLSGRLTRPEEVCQAAREARWALHGAASDRSRLRRYGEDSSWTITLERSDEVVEHVLGKLIQYDRNHQTELVRTLAVLLRHNRSPGRAADELFIHRQTLVYRMRRIEELTSRRLSSTRDIVEFWLALRAAEVVGGVSLLGAEDGRAAEGG